MERVGDQKQITSEERSQISKQVQADLLDHLYRGCLPGTISGIIASFAIFIIFYNYTSFPMLLAWMIFFNVMMVSLSTLYFSYIKFRASLSLNTWEQLYSIMMCACAVSWIPVIYLLPNDLTRQYLGLVAFFLAVTGYATGTIGQFKLCVATLLIMLLPLIAWCVLKGGIFYTIVAVYSLIYMAFMMGTNHRSTMWFKESIKLKLENTLVSYQANHDLLTDLPNQRLLPQFIEEAIAFAKSTDKCFALVSFSLNRMEIINDTLGHQAGDSIIQQVASRLVSFSKQIVRQYPDHQCLVTISRKDTFNILLIPMTTQEANDRIRDLFAVLEDPFAVADQNILVTASVGISFYPQDGESIDSLLIAADTAMLNAKHFGGNRIEFYRADVNTQSARQLELETDLHAALKNNQLQVYYQPLVNLATGEITGLEALVRWPHPVHGFIPPSSFIPLAEATGLIIPMGAWILQEACLQTRMWHQMGFTSLKIAVNLSEKQIRDGSILGTVIHVLSTTNFDPQFLELELTETAMLDEAIIGTIKEFKKLGLSLAVDDFGTGYSGLSYLKKFSIDKIKIDQSFIRDLPDSNDSITIVSAILAMAKELNIITLAEGIETEAQMLFLRERGCLYGQGYYFSKPIEAHSLTRLLLNNRDTLVKQGSNQEAIN